MHKVLAAFEAGCRRFLAAAAAAAAFEAASNHLRAAASCQVVVCLPLGFAAGRITAEEGMHFETEALVGKEIHPGRQSHLGAVRGTLGF